MKKIMLIIFIVFLLVIAFFFVGSPKKAENIQWGVNFSQKQAELLGLNWKENYLALIEDLGAKDIKLASYWDLIEKKEGEYDFQDLDWQIKTAKEKEVKLLLVIGMKTPRWPECHIPEWAKSKNKEEQQERILNLIEKIILRYKDSTSIKMWQVENEPFFPFGECPRVDKDFLKEEINLVKSLDEKGRPIVISDSGEGSLWIQAARFGDVVGTTMYEKVWVRQFGVYINYPFPPIFYWRKAQMVKTLFNKEVICIEFQAEPWGKKLLSESPVEEQQKTMNLDLLRKNIEFAKQTGLKKFYLWGGEWWYWLKEKQGNSEIWEEVKKLFINN